MIRKGLIYSKSDLVKKGLYFILPDIVYKKFEDIVGDDIPISNINSANIVNVHTYSLSDPVEYGHQRHIILELEIKFELNEFSHRFITGVNLPSGEDLDHAVRRVLGLR